MNHRVRPRRLLATLVMALLSLLSGTALAAPAAAAETPPQRATFGIQPAGTKGPDSRPYLLYPVSAGSQVTDHVAAINYSSSPITLRVYATDAFNAEDGTFSLLARKTAAKLAGTWLSLAVPGGGEFVTVGPRSYKIIDVTLKTPAGAGPGDHVAGVVAALTTTTKTNGGPAVELDQRVGIRTFVRVSGPLQPKLSIEKVHRAYHGTANPVGRGRTTVTYTVHNTGNVALGGAQRVAAYGLAGPSIQAQKLPDLPLLIPGGSVTVTAQVPHTWPLIWMTAKIQIAPQLVKGVSSGNVPEFDDVGRYFAIPWPLLLILMALVGLDQVRRRRRDPGPSDGEAERTKGRHAAPRREPTPSASTTTVGRVVLAGWLLALIGAGPAAAEEQVPYTDSRVTGGITFCGVDGKPVYTGKVTDMPFVWLAIGDTAATGVYAEPGRTAFLGAYQPRKGIDPGAWNGFAENASSAFDTVAHPAAQSTPRSSTLNAFLLRYHADWDGYVQLRLILLGSNRPVQTSRYDATDIRVVGDTWHVVRGGRASCSSGKATSTAVLLGVPGASGTPSPGAVASPPKLTTSPKPQSTVGAAGLPGSTAAAAAPSASAEPVAASSKGVLGASLVPILLIAGVAALGTGLVTAWAMRRRA